jgi:hypothetical protein
MEFLKKLNLKPILILKIVGLALIAIVLMALTFRLLGSSLNSLINQKNPGRASEESVAYDMAQVADNKLAAYGTTNSAGLSIRNAVSAPSTIPRPGTAGDQAEEFEVTEYHSLIKTRRLAKTCAVLAELKAKDYVIFENANQADKNCNYTFKVKNDRVEEILGIVKSLNPKELSQNTYTIKRLVDDYTGQLDILEKKKKTIDETLESAIKSYDEITTLATRTQDVASLAKIIDSKINIIERLTQERLNVSEQLDLLGRSKAEQLDRLEYTYFYLNIVENKYVDLTGLKDSWQAAIKEFIRDVNGVIQDITINLIALLFYIFQYALYLFILLVVAKYGWRLGKYIWNK